jgi:hypothetical protein
MNNRPASVTISSQQQLNQVKDQSQKHQADKFRKKKRFIARKYVYYISRSSEVLSQFNETDSGSTSDRSYTLQTNSLSSEPDKTLASLKRSIHSSADCVNHVSQCCNDADTTSIRNRVDTAKPFESRRTTRPTKKRKVR